MRRVVLGWCVGGGAILERREGELSQRALYRRQRAAMVRQIVRLGSQQSIADVLDGSLLHPVQPIQVGRSCPNPDDWAVRVLHNNCNERLFLQQTTIGDNDLSPRLR